MADDLETWYTALVARVLAIKFVQMMTLDLPWPIIFQIKSLRHHMVKKKKKKKKKEKKKERQNNGFDSVVAFDIKVNLWDQVDELL